MPTDLDTIKVVIRIKGKEDLTTEEKNSWKINDRKGEITLSEDQKSEKITYDHILVENT